MIEFALDPGFWVGLGQIVLVNLILSGDNAVVIALAARELPERERRQAIVLGSLAAIVMRVLLTLVASEMLKLPYLKLIGSALLFWIALQLLRPETSAEDDIEGHNSLIGAIRTILLADLVMSLDNVIAVAAAAHGSALLLSLGLGISIPLVIFGSTLVLKLMDRFPWFVVLGAGLLGYVAGEMLVSDPVLAGWPALGEDSHLHLLVPAFSGLAVVLLGKALGARAAGRSHEPLDLAETANSDAGQPQSSKTPLPQRTLKERRHVENTRTRG